MGKYAITYDIGTTGVKTCIFELGDTIKLVSAASEGYNLYVFPDGGAEQDPLGWFRQSPLLLERLPKKETMWLFFRQSIISSIIPFEIIIV